MKTFLKSFLASCPSMIFFLLSVYPDSHVLANPANGQVVAGQVSINQETGLTTVIQKSERAVINWKDFSIGSGEVARFVQPSSDSAVLNRVTGSLSSDIDGTLSANGQVFLINPNGVIVGSGGRIQTGGFVASTLDVSDSAFMKGGDLNLSGGSSAGVINLGIIKAADGDIFLVGRQVENDGTLIAHDGMVGLAAGNQVLLTKSGDERISIKAGLNLEGDQGTGIDNTGLIEAAQAELQAVGGNVYALAINNSGIIRATGISSEDGRVLLKVQGGSIDNSGAITALDADGNGGDIRLQAEGDTASWILSSGTMDASSTKAGGMGGTVTLTADDISLLDDALIDASGDAGGGIIQVGGGPQGSDPGIYNAENLSVASDVQINADAVTTGDGGQVVFWSDYFTDFYGNISATGGTVSGNGGSAEVSGGLLNYKGFTDLRASNGAWGTLLLDPTDVLIGSNWTTDTSNSTKYYYDPEGISTWLATAGVTIQADNNISFEGGEITWTAGTRLTLDAGNKILLYTDSGYTTTKITGTNGELYLKADGITADSDSTIGIDVAKLLVEPVFSSSSSFQIHSQVTADTFQIIGRENSFLTDLVTFNLDNSNNDISSILLGDGSGPYPAVLASILNLPANITIVTSGDVSIETPQDGYAGWIQMDGDLTILSGGDITLENFIGFRSDSYDEDLVLSAEGNFYNLGTPVTTGSVTSQLPFVSTIKIFSTLPTSDNLGTDQTTWSGMTRVYDTTYADITSLSGSHFYYSYQPVVTISADDLTKIYGAYNDTLTWSASGVITGDTLSGNPTLSTEVGLTTSVGTYDISVDDIGTLSGPEGYKLVLSTTPGTYTVNKAYLNILVNNCERTYGESNPSAFTASYYGYIRSWDKDADGNPLPGVADGLVFYTDATEQSNAGTYTIYADASGFTSTNYYIMNLIDGTLTVNKAPLTITANNVIRRIGDANPDLTATYTGLMSWDMDASGNPTSSAVSDLFIVTGDAPDSPPGNYVIIPFGATASNYAVTYVSGTLTVKEPYQLVITVNDTTKVYGDTNPDFTVTYTGFEDGDTEAVVSGLMIATGADEDSDVGTYLISASGVSLPAYYTVTYVDGRLQITPRNLNLYAQDITAVYGDTPLYSYTATGLMAGDSLIMAPTFTASGLNAGSNLIYLTGADAGDNYTITYHNGKLTVTPALLTITANDASMYVNEDLPTFKVTMSGLKYNDNAGVVSGLNLVASDSYNGETLTSSDSNTYKYIVQDGTLTAANYTINFIPGILTIDPTKVINGTLSITEVTTISSTTSGNQGYTYLSEEYWRDPFGVSYEGADALRYVARNLIRQLGLNVTNVDVWMMDSSNRALMTNALLEFLKSPLKEGTDLYNQREIVKTALESQIRAAKVKIAQQAVAAYNEWKSSLRAETRLMGLFGDVSMPDEDFVANATASYLAGAISVASLATLGATIATMSSLGVFMPAAFSGLTAGLLSSSTASTSLLGISSTAFSGLITAAGAASGIIAGVAIAVAVGVTRGIQVADRAELDDRYEHLVENAQNFDIDSMLYGDDSAQAELYGQMLAIALQ